MAATIWRAVALEAYDVSQPVQAVDLAPILSLGGDSHYGQVDVLVRGVSGIAQDVGPLSLGLTQTGVTYSASTPGAGFAQSAECSTSKKIEIPSIAGFAGDLTLEFWLQLKTVPAMGPLHSIISRAASGTNGGFGFYFLSGKLNLTWGNGGNRMIGSWPVPTTGAWHHLAVTRQGGVVRGWVNGVKSWETTSTEEVAALGVHSSLPITIGGDGFYGSGMPEFLINDFRITRGVARYVADFDLPSAHSTSADAGGQVAHASTYALSASELPVSGALADLSDPSVNSPVQLASLAPGFYLRWVFDAPVDLAGLALRGVFASSALQACVLQVLDEISGAWITQVRLGAVEFDADAVVHATSLGNAPLRAVPVKGVHFLAAAEDYAALMYLEMPLTAIDMENGGKSSIYGTVELSLQSGNIPLPRRVRLYRSRDGLLVREMWSDAQGNYRFDGITDRYQYDVIAWDHEGLHQSVVANDLTPELMP